MAYLGCGTSANKARWCFIVLCLAIFAALYVSVTLLGRSCELCNVDDSEDCTKVFQTVETQLEDPDGNVRDLGGMPWAP